MGEGGGTRKSSRVPTETEKRKAAGKLNYIQCPASGRLNTNYIVDEGSEEQLKKKIRALEEKNVKLTGTNTALSDAVQALHKEKVDTCRNTNTANNRGTNNDNDDGNNNEDDDNDGNDDGDDGGDNGLPVLFNAGKVLVLLYYKLLLRRLLTLLNRSPLQTAQIQMSSGKRSIRKMVI